MDNQIQTFDVPEFGKIRFVIIDGDPWFVVADIATALGLQNIRQNLSELDDDEKQLISLPPGVLKNGVTAERIQNIHSTVTPFLRKSTVVNEPGLYRLIFASRKPEAENFKRKVYHEILPSIRKTGMYVANPAMRRQLELILDAEYWAEQSPLSARLKKYYKEQAELFTRLLVEQSLAYDEVGKLAVELRNVRNNVDVETPYFIRRFIAEHCDFDPFAHVPAAIFIERLRATYPEQTATMSNRAITGDLRCVRGIRYVRDGYGTFVFGIKFKAPNLP